MSVSFKTFQIPDPQMSGSGQYLAKFSRIATYHSQPFFKLLGREAMLNGAVSMMLNIIGVMELLEPLKLGFDLAQHEATLGGGLLVGQRSWHKS
jgi:hypothetical protein